MTVDQLATVLARAADLIDAAGGKPVEVRQLADRLRPFAPQSLAAFGDFLAIAAGHAKGELTAYFPDPNSKEAKSKGANASNQFSPQESEKVAAAVRQLTDLYERALDDDVTAARVDEVLTPIGKLTVPLLNEVAAGCGFRQKFKKKGDTLDALRKWVLGRKGSHERAGA